MQHTMTLQLVKQSLLSRLERNKGDILTSPNPEDSLREHVDSKMPAFVSDAFRIASQENWLGPQQPDFGSPTMYELVQDCLFNNLMETANEWLAINQL